MDDASFIMAGSLIDTDTDTTEDTSTYADFIMATSNINNDMGRTPPRNDGNERTDTDTDTDTESDTDTDTDTDTDSDDDTALYEYPGPTPFLDIDISNNIKYLAGVVIIFVLMYIVGTYAYYKIENKETFLYFLLFGIFVFANVMLINIYNV